MHVIAINGSPRKSWNTATLLTKALDGAASKGAKTEIIHLYDFNFKGCISCFACKLRDGRSYGRCAYQDDLTPILEKIENADAVILGSPIYLGNVSGEMRSLMERMVFQYLVYDEAHSSLVEKKKPIGFIYTMNIKESMVKDWGYDRIFLGNQALFKRIFGASDFMYSTDTYQFNDYSKYVATGFNEAEKAKIRQEEFPKDCTVAFDMGVKFATME